MEANKMDIIKWVGLAASFCSSVALVPQLAKLLKTKDAKNLSLIWLSVLLLGVGLWVVYGVMKKDWIIIGSNIVAVSVNGLMAFFTGKYKKASAKA